MDATVRWINDNKTLIAALVGIGLLWGTQVGAVSNKADKAEVQSVANEVRAMRTELAADMRVLMEQQATQNKILCSLKPKDSLCP